MNRARSRDDEPLDRASLLRIPLVRRAFSHESIRPTPRALDRTWGYQRLVGSSHVGFVPFTQRVFYGSVSRTASWSRKKAASARALNEDDLLVSEVFFCVHDFLHAWALATVREVAPELRVEPGLGEAEREELAFVHLVTEAVATVGFDYWYLSVVDPNDVCPLGTRAFPLTVTYEERHLREYRRARRGLVVQRPAFFAEVVEFYAGGVFRGFDREDLAASPVLKRWVGKEVVYGERQRRYIRAWLDFVTGAREGEHAERAVTSRPRWARELVRLLAHRLWRLAKDDVDEAPTGRSDLPFEAARPKGFDPRFMNVRIVPEEDLVRVTRRFQDTGLRDLVCDQYVSGFERARFEGDLAALSRAREARDVAALRALLRGVPRVKARRDEPELLFLLG